MSFKKDQKVRCVDAKDNSQIDIGDELVVMEDQAGSFVKLKQESGKEIYFYAYRFELVQQFPTLVAGQRVTCANGQKGIVVANADEGLALKLEKSTWVKAGFDMTGSYAEWNVVAVYSAPHAYRAFEFDAKGGLVWDKEGAAEKIAEAQAKLEEARAAAQAANDAVLAAEQELSKARK